MSARFPLLLCVGLAALTGCMQLDTKDVSTQARYQSMLGREFELVEEFRVMGVRHDLRATQPDFLALYARPGVGGPEFFDYGVRPAGTRLRIVGVIARTSPLFPEVVYVARLTGESVIAAGLSEIRIAATANPKAYEAAFAPGDAPPLNPALFQPVPVAAP